LGPISLTKNSKKSKKVTLRERARRGGEEGGRNGGTEGKGSGEKRTTITAKGQRGNSKKNLKRKKE